MRRALQALLFAALAAAAFVPATFAQRGPVPPPAIEELPVAELPKEARDTLAKIRKGGPYPYAKDGTIFGNREGLLPKQKRGYYHEYTVRTPGSRTRGARRLVTGNGGEVYYTADHYNSFRRVRE